MAADENPPYYDLVVIGSSAGGIEALSRLVSTLPASFPAPIVLAQHLDPSRTSRLSKILARHTTLPVHQLDDGTPQPLRPGIVYVAPAARDVAIEDNTIHLRSNAAKYVRPSIDLLLTSAAQSHGERTIAVILTGTGSDGADGARRVKAAGGMVIIENPETATYPTLPASLAPSTVDLAANLDRIGPLLYDLLTGAYLMPSPATTPDGSLEVLLDAVQAQTGIDFTQYKPATISRRIQRRMAATATLTFGEYVYYIEHHPDEYARLAASFLINVTEFFRDQALYDYLRENVVPNLIAYARAHNNHLRIWSAGCATGEEPYSIAMLIAEQLGSELAQFSVHIFATDADTEAIIFARRGIYPPAALKTVPDRYKARYFTHVEGGYSIDRRIRGMVVFGEHDLGKRAPFPDMDLVLCRNVLIYFTSELQRRALHLFAFSLRHDGYLVLGAAETANALPAYFDPVDTHCKVYRRHGGRVLVSAVPMRAPLASPTFQRTSVFPLGLVQRTSSRSALEPSQAHASDDSRVDESPSWMRIRTTLDKLGEQILGLSAGVVVVNRQYDVQVINSAAYALLDIVHDAHGKDLLHLAERVPTKPLRGAIDAAFHAAPLGRRHVPVALALSDGESRRLQITCYPHSAESVDSTGIGVVDAVVLLITDVSDEQPQPAESEGQQALAVRQVASSGGRRRRGRIEAQAAAEVEGLREALDHAQATIRELRDANQELREANQELIRGNDELLVRQEEAQAATEQAKTLNEELQATNEELETLNEEMEATLEQLHTTNDDLQARAQELEELAMEREAQQQESDRERMRFAAILSSMSDALLVVDTAGKPVVTNPAYDQLFGASPAVVVLEDGDGRPLPAAATPQRRVLEGTSFTMEFGVSSNDGTQRWFEARGEPIHEKGGVLGGVIAVRDITERSALVLQEQFLTLASHELRGPMASLQLALRMLSRTRGADVPNDTISQFHDIALRQADLLHAVIDDLSDLARARHGKLVFQLRPVDLATLTQQVIADLNMLHAGHEDSYSIHFQLLPETDAGRPLMIHGDSNRLEQVVHNLVTNALTHAATSQRIDVILERKDTWAELRVQDYGPGIPPADLPRLFTPYFQSSRTASATQQGLGLGLFIVAEFVKAHGGTVAAESAPGQGTCFVVRFPLSASQPDDPIQFKHVAEHAMMVLPAHAHLEDTEL